MRIGLVDVKDTGSWGPLSTESRCQRRGQHRFTPWKAIPGRDGKGIYWVRGCDRCRWVFSAEPIVAGPHVLDRTVGEWIGMPMGVCRCGKAWPHRA